MDTTMLKPNSTQALMQLIRRILLEVNTAIPGEVVVFDPLTQTATIKPCIKNTTIDNDGQTEYIELPQIVECPVFFPYSAISKFSITYPVVPGDQCLIIFSQRSNSNFF